MNSYMMDAVFSDERRTTRDGYLIASARVAKGDNVQEYLADEMPDAIGHGFQPGQVVRVFRPASEVFSRDTMRSFAHRPVTFGHPSEPVTADTWKQFSAGQSGEDVARDGDFIRVPMLVMDRAAIDAVNAGTSELSMGYNADIDWSAGKTPSGLAYDAIQRNIRNNHIAIVDRARAGHEARIGDTGDQTQLPADKDEGRKMADNLQTVVIDGLSVETTKQGAEGIAKLQQQVTDAKAETTTALEGIATKDAELAKRDAEIDDLKSKVMDAGALDKAVQERSDLVMKAKAIVDADYSGMADAEIRKSVVASYCDVSGKPEAYIDVRFDILCEDGTQNKTTADKQPATDNDAVQDAYDKRTANAWKRSA